MILDLARTYWELILTERGWSWAVIGLVYLLAALLVRHWFLRPLTTKAKSLKRPQYEELKSVYLKRAIWGWLFFVVSFLVVVILWNRGAEFPLTGPQALIVLGAFASYILSILLHVGAIGEAGIITLKNLTEKEHPV